MAKSTHLVVTPATGSGNNTLSVGASAHTGRTSRTGSFSVVAGSITRVVTVNQAAKAEYVSVESVTYAVAKTGGTVTVKGKSNSAGLGFSLGKTSVTSTVEELSLTLPATYNVGGTAVEMNVSLIPNDPGASNEYEWTVQFTIPVNNTVKTLERPLTITADGGQSVSTTIQQAKGDPTLTVSPITVNLTAAGTAVSVTVTSNTNWSIV